MTSITETRCQANVAPTYEQCPNQAVVAETIGCVHEHIREVRTCARHLELKRLCKLCRAAGARVYVSVIS